MTDQRFTSADAGADPEPYGGELELAEFGVKRRWMESSELRGEWIPQIIEVLRAAFNGGPRWFRYSVAPADHLLWKVRDLPAGGYVALMFDGDDRVIAYTGSMLREFLLRGKVRIVRDGVDVSLHPSWQGRGLNRSLSGYRGHDWHPRTELAFGYETHPTLRQRAIEAGIQGIANGSRDFVLPLHPLAIARGLLRRGPRESEAAGRADAPPSRTRDVLMRRETRYLELARRSARLGVEAARTALAWRPASTDAAGMRILTQDHVDGRFDALWAEAAGQFDFVQVRSARYLNWRFLDRRAGPFIFRAAFEGERAVGYAVTHLFEGEAYLMDLFALPGRTDVIEALVRDSIRLAKRTKAPTMRTRLTKHHPYRAVLRRCGFVDLGHVAGELIDPRKIDREALAFLDDEGARVHLTLSDSDSI